MVEQHRSQGTTASFLGANAVPWDRFARRARLDDTARRCFDNLDDGTAAWVSAYVDGVNAGLERGAAAAPEFATTGLAPQPWQQWTPLGVWLAHHILFAGFPTKLWREEVARRLGDEAIELFATDDPGTAGSNGWMVPGERTMRRRAAHHAATRTASSRIQGSTSRYICPARSTTSSASPSPASPVSPTSATPEPWPGPSPTPCPTTTTCTGNGCAVRAAASRRWGPGDGGRPFTIARPSRWQEANRSRSR